MCARPDPTPPLTPLRSLRTSALWHFESHPTRPSAAQRRSLSGALAAAAGTTDACSSTSGGGRLAPVALPPSMGLMMGDVVPSARLAAEEAEAPRRSSMASEEALQQLLDVAETLRTEVATRFGRARAS